MNLKVGRVTPLRAVCALPSCGAHGVTRPTGSRPMHDRIDVKAFHEPSTTNPPLTPPGRGLGHAVRLPSLEGLGVGSWSQCIRKNELADLRTCKWTNQVNI